MEKVLKHYKTVLIICIVILAGTFTFSIKAEEYQDSNYIIEEPIDDPMAIYEHDQYGYAGWSSLAQAKAYYGYNWTYVN